jgi:MazG family protein
MLGRALALVRYLREHCDWDARQTPGSLLPYLLEEAHEVAETVRRGDDGELPGELGDLLLNLAFQVVLAEERRAFGVREVVTELEHKMVARHPHVYGDAHEAPDWESLKAGERAERAGHAGRTALADDRTGGRADRPHDPLVGIPAGLEPLSRALRVQERAAGVGFDWPDVSGAIDKLREEIDELAGLVGGRTASPSSAGRPPTAEIVDEAGDLLFAAVNVCRLAGVHPSTALATGTEKFARRFRAVADRSRAAGLELAAAGLETLDRIWNEVKRDEDRGQTDDRTTTEDRTSAEA